MPLSSICNAEGRRLEVGRYWHCQYRYDIDICDPKYWGYRYPLL